MGRTDDIARSIQHAMLSEDPKQRRSRLRRIASFASVRSFFTIHRLKLSKFESGLFEQLRSETWNIDEDEYRESFLGDSALCPKGDMGYSGSTFYTTRDGAHLIKSVPRQFEHSFFRDDLLGPYVQHQQQHPRSLLVRISDFLGWSHYSLGGVLGLTPTHHIIMENLVTGEESAKDSGRAKWEVWDLKPTSYFFPERDIAGGRLSSAATKSRLADKFEDKIRLDRSQAEEFLAQLTEDTKLLESFHAVDYSLMLVRIPAPPPEDPFSDENEQRDEYQIPENSPAVPPAPPTWHTGIMSTDGRYLFRATVLDFFWSKEKSRAKMMDFFVNTFNIVGRHGPMSITTTPEEYRERFLAMCQNIVEASDP